MGDGRHLGGRAHDEAFVKVFQFVGHDAALDHFEALFLGQRDHGLAGEAVQEAIGDGGVKLAVGNFGEFR